MSTPFRVKHGLIAGVTSENTSPIVASNQVLTGSSSTPLVDLAAAWNTTGTPTAFKLNVTDTASNASSLLMDLQVGGSSKFSFRKDGLLTINYPTSGIGIRVVGNGNGLVASRFGSDNTGYTGYGPRLANDNTIEWSATTNGTSGSSLILGYRGAANLRLGAADAASPVAQTLSVQSVAAGQTNVAGANFTITGSQGTGSGAGGSIVFQVAPAGGSGTAQNALVDAFRITSARNFEFIGAAPSRLIFAGESITARNTINTADKALISQYGIRASSDIHIGFSNSTTSLSTLDTLLYRDAAATLALRNGTNAQTFRIYNTYTDSSNYERGKISWDSNVFKIGTENAGTGTARALEFQTDGTTRLTIDSNAGSARFGSGPSAQFGWYNAYNNLVFEAWESSGIRRFVVNGRILLEGTTSSFPALKRSSASLQVRLADDSAFTTLEAGSLIATNPAENTSAISSSGFSLTGSNAQSLVDLSGTWNTTGTPTAFKLNVTDTASNASSLLMDLQVGGVSKFRFTKTGQLRLSDGQISSGYGLSFIGNTGNGFYSPGATTNNFYASIGTNAVMEFRISGIGLGNGSLSWGAIGATQDLFLTRRGAANLRLGETDAASPVAQTLSVQSVAAGQTNVAGANFTITGSQGTGSGAGGSIVFQVAPAGSSGTAQNSLVTFLEATSTRAFNLYNTADVTTNYERLSLRYESASTAFVIAAESNGTGTNRELKFKIGGTDRWVMQTAGHFLTIADNAYDIGASSANRPRRLYIAGGSLTGSAADSSLEISPTWNTTGTPTAFKLNVTDTASASGSLLMDLQVGGTSKLRVGKSGNLVFDRTPTTLSTGMIQVADETAGQGKPGILSSRNLDGSNPTFATYGSGGSGNAGQIVVRDLQTRNKIAITGSVVPTSSNFEFDGFLGVGLPPDLILGRRAAANLRLGAADAASPVAQTLSVQSVAAGQTNVAGANFTITGSQGTGSGAGGSIVFQVAPAGSSGTAQNALVNALFISPNELLQFGGTTSSFPALKRSGTQLKVRLADDSGDGDLSARYIITPANTVANLVSAATIGAGARAFVTDSNTNIFLTVVGSGGANAVPVISDGTNWLVG